MLTVAPASDEASMDSDELLTVTTPLPDWPGLPTLVAVTTIEAAGVEGAVKRPEPEIEPAEADHVTAVLLVPLTFAVNCCVAEGAKLTADGLTVTLTASDVWPRDEEFAWLTPAQPAVSSSSPASAIKAIVT
jgi:hypothetical protein